MRPLLLLALILIASPAAAVELQCGGVDDTAAMNAAVTAALAANGPLILPAATCKYSDTIVLTKAIPITGKGQYVSNLSYCGASDAIRLDLSGFTMGQRLTDFSVRACVDDDAHGDNGIEVKLGATASWAYSGIEHVMIGRFANYGLRLENAVTTNNDGFFVLKFDSMYISNGVEGIRIGDSVEFNNTQVHGRNKVKISAVPSAIMFKYIGGEITTRGGFMDLTDVYNARIRDVEMEFPLAEGSPTTSFNGIVTYGGGYSQFSGNTLNPSGTYGHMFALIGTPGTQIIGNSFLGTPAYAHIYGTSGSTGTIFCNRDNAFYGVTPVIVPSLGC